MTDWLSKLKAGDAVGIRRRGAVFGGHYALTHIKYTVVKVTPKFVVVSKCPGSEVKVVKETGRVVGQYEHLEPWKPEYDTRIAAYDRRCAILAKLRHVNQFNFMTAEGLETLDKLITTDPGFEK